MGFLQNARLIVAYVLARVAERIAGDLSDEAESPVSTSEEELQTPVFVPTISPVVQPTARALEMLAEGRPTPPKQQIPVDVPLKGSLRARGIR